MARLACLVGQGGVVAGGVEVSWVELAQLMVRVRDPEPTLHGVIRSRGSAGEPDNSTGWFGGGRGLPPVFTGVPSGTGGNLGVVGESEQRVTVWRDGPRVRVELPDGSPWLITDGERRWSFPVGDDSAVVQAAEPVAFRGSGTHLLRRRTAADIAGLGDPTGPVSGTTFLGRAAWRVTLQPADVPGAQREVVVDAETGLVLRQHRTGSGAVDEWVSLTVGTPPLDAELFCYDGPEPGARSPEDRRAEDLASYEQTRGRQRAWFQERVTSTPLQAEVVHELTVQWVRTVDEKTGAFEATLGAGRGTAGGTLARRPHSTEPWELSWSTVDHRWRTTRWDWALTLHGTTLTDAGRATIEHQLGDAP